MNEVNDEITALIQGIPSKPDDPAEVRTDDQEPEPEAAPLAAESDEPEQSETDDVAEEAPAPSTFKGLAEKLDMSVKDLYAVEIPLGDDGSVMTLGEVKNRWKDLKQADEMLLQSEDKRISTENELQAKIRDQQIAQANPNLSPEQRQAYLNKYVEQANAEAIRTIDGWSDPLVAKAELGAIGELLAEYGKTAAQISQVIEPTDLRMLNDYARLRARVKSATTTEVKTKRKQSQRNSDRKAAKPARQKITEAFNKGELSQTAAIQGLIANG
jgi:hypothetical protein